MKFKLEGMNVGKSKAKQKFITFGIWLFEGIQGRMCPIKWTLQEGSTAT